MTTVPHRVTADVDHDFVVFLIGMRFKLRHIRRWRRLISSMPKMIHELTLEPSSGFLGGESWIGNPTIMVQYWRSFDDLTRYAHDPHHHHRPAWAAFNRAVRDGIDVGVWHEAYRVRPGDFEVVYHNMPPFGLARATREIPATGPRHTATGRVNAPVTKDEVDHVV